jgi:hypothetical protein
VLDLLRRAAAVVARCPRGTHMNRGSWLLDDLNSNSQVRVWQNMGALAETHSGRLRENPGVGVPT